MNWIHINSQGVAVTLLPNFIWLSYYSESEQAVYYLLPAVALW